MIKFTVPDIPPSNNKYMGNSNSHHIYRQDKQQWEALIGWSVRAAGWRGEPLPRALVRITYHFKDRRRRDPDNYSGKFILDGLKAAGVIEDDSFQNVKLELEGEFGCKEKETVIEVKEAG